MHRATQCLLTTSCFNKKLQRLETCILKKTVILVSMQVNTRKSKYEVRGK